MRRWHNRDRLFGDVNTHAHTLGIDVGEAGAQRIGGAQIIETEIGGEVWLVVPFVARPRLADIGPFREAPAPPQVILRCRVELRQIEGQHPYPVEFADELAPLLHQALLVGDDGAHLAGDRLPIGGDAEMVDDDGLVQVAHAPAGRAQAQTEIDILAICGPEPFVEQRIAHQIASHHQRGARTVRDVAVIAVARLVRVAEEPYHAAFTVRTDEAAGFLEPPVGIDDLRANRTECRVIVERGDHARERAGEQLGIIVEQQHIAAPALREGGVAVADKPLVGSLAHEGQVLHLAQQQRLRVGRAIVGQHHLEGHVRRVVHHRKQAIRGVVDLVIDRDQYGQARPLRDREFELLECGRDIGGAKNPRCRLDHRLDPTLPGARHQGASGLVARSHIVRSHLHRQPDGYRAHCRHHRLGGNIGRDLPPLRASAQQEMPQRWHPGGGDVGIAGPIQQPVEVRPRGPPLDVAKDDEMAQRVIGVWTHIRILRGVPDMVEIRIGRDARRSPLGQEMAQHAMRRRGAAKTLAILERIEIGTWRDQVVFQKFEDRLGTRPRTKQKRVGLGDEAQIDQRMRRAQFFRSGLDEMQQRIEA